jgi:regulator of sigma E protease
MFESLSVLPGPAQLALAFVLALFPLVLVHELGHFLIAKLNKVRVEEFGIGFPPRVFRLATVGETDYTVNALPVGGFVRLAGEDDPEVPGSFAGRSKAARTAILLAGPAANFAFAALVMGVLAASGPIPEELPGIQGVTIISVSPESPAAEAGLQEMDLIVAADGTVLAEGQPSRRPGEGETLATVTLQEVTDAARERPMTMTVLRGLERVPIDSLPEGVVTEDPELPGVTGLAVVSAPSGSGLQSGDLLLAGTSSTSSGGDEQSDEAPPVGAAGSLLGRAPGNEDGQLVAVTAPELVEVTVTPYYDEDAKRGLVGITIVQPMVMAQLGVPAALVHGARTRTTVLMTDSMINGLVGMIRRETDADLRGPLGIAELSKETMDRGAQTFLQFMAVLSINLAIINLLPIPALDGGRLLFIAAEAVRGRRIEPTREAVVHLIGFALVIGLMAMLTVFDGWRMLSGP